MKIILSRLTTNDRSDKGFLWSQILVKGWSACPKATVNVTNREKVYIWKKCPIENIYLGDKTALTEMVYRKVRNYYTAVVSASKNAYYLKELMKQKAMEKIQVFSALLKIILCRCIPVTLLWQMAFYVSSQSKLQN